TSTCCRFGCHVPAGEGAASERGHNGGCEKSAKPDGRKRRPHDLAVWRLAVPVWLSLECRGIYLDRGRCGRRQPTSVEIRTTPRVSGHRHRVQRISEAS